MAEFNEFGLYQAISDILLTGHIFAAWEIGLHQSKNTSVWRSSNHP